MKRCEQKKRKKKSGTEERFKIKISLFVVLYIIVFALIVGGKIAVEFRRESRERRKTENPPNIEKVIESENYYPRHFFSADFTGSG